MRLKKMFPLALGTAAIGGGLAAVVVACGSASADPKPAEPQENRNEEAVAAYGKGSGFAEPPSEAPAEGYKPWSGPVFTSLDGTTTYAQAEVDGFALGTSFKAVWTAEVADGYSGKAYTYTKTFAVKDNAPPQADIVDEAEGTYVQDYAAIPPTGTPPPVASGYAEWTGPIYKSQNNTETYTLEQIEAITPGTKIAAVYTAPVGPDYAGKPYTYTKLFTVKGVASVQQNVVDATKGTYAKDGSHDADPGAPLTGYLPWSDPVFTSLDGATTYTEQEVQALAPGTEIKVVFTAGVDPNYEGSPYTYTKTLVVKEAVAPQSDIVEERIGEYVKGETDNPPVATPPAVAAGYDDWSGPVLTSDDGATTYTLAQIDAMPPGSRFRVVYTAEPSPTHTGDSYTYTKRFSVKQRAAEQKDVVGTEYGEEATYYLGTVPIPPKFPLPEGYSGWLGPVFKDPADDFTFNLVQVERQLVDLQVRMVWTAILDFDYAGKPFTYTRYVEVRGRTTAQQSVVDPNPGVAYTGAVVDPVAPPPAAPAKGYKPWSGPVYKNEDGSQTMTSQTVRNLPVGARFKAVYATDLVAGYYGGGPYTYTKNFAVEEGVGKRVVTNDETVSWHQTSYGQFFTEGYRPAPLPADKYAAWTVKVTSADGKTEYADASAVNALPLGTMIKFVYEATPVNGHKGPSYAHYKSIQVVKLAAGPQFLVDGQMGEYARGSSNTPKPTPTEDPPEGYGPWGELAYIGWVTVDGHTQKYGYTEDQIRTLKPGSEFQVVYSSYPEPYNVRYSDDYSTWTKTYTVV